MNFWDYLRKQATKALVNNIADEYHELGELHRQHQQKKVRMEE